MSEKKEVPQIPKTDLPKSVTPVDGSVKGQVPKMVNPPPPPSKKNS